MHFWTDDVEIDDVNTFLATVTKETTGGKALCIS